MASPHWQRLKCKIYQASTQVHKMLIKQNSTPFEAKQQGPNDK